MRRPLGCLTVSGLIAAILVALAVVGAAVATGNGIFSPGQLSAVAHGGPVGGVGTHADLGGRCEACHAPVWSGDRMGDLCLTCHERTRDEIATKDGLHGRLAASAANCRDCHTDHRGATAELTLADPSAFPHEQTGYVLTAHPLRSPTGILGGGNGGITCRSCHPGSPTVFTPPVCASCHETLDPPYMAQHTATFGSGCLACHDGVDTYGKAFDHGRTYELTGGHAGVSCDGCHQGAATPAQLQATPTECSSCHAARDVHEGRLGTTCAECHTGATWAGATIDHDRTRYRLEGKHVGVLCESCHVDRHWTGIGMTCRSCHAKDDPHAGQFAGDCASCHAPSGWEDVAFDHATTRFALAGAHAKPACVACHAKGRYVDTPTKCVACHAGDDEHRGALGKDCASCHKATTWADATFDHSKAAFPLSGAHRSVTCLKCHKGGVYRGTPKTCAACHRSPASHGSAYDSRCASCHTTRAWLPGSFTGTHPFPKAHHGADGVCSRCHPSSWSSYSCARCHSNTKMSEHHKEVPNFSLTTCASCHPTGRKGD